MEELKIEQQVALEEEMRGLGINRYLKKMSKGEEAELPPGAAILRRTVAPVATLIQEWVDDLNAGNARQMAGILRHIEAVGVAQAAYITMRRVVNAIGNREKVTALAVALAGDIKDEIGYKAFREANKKVFERITEKVKVSGSAHYRRTVINLMKNREGIADQDMSKEDKLKLGTKLIEFAIAATGMLEMITVVEGKNNRAHYLMGTQAARDWLSNQHNYCQVLAPLYLPMVCKPNDWEGPKSGGYFTHKLDLIKTPNRHYLEELEHFEMPMVYQAVNGLQATPWRINKRILETMKALWEVGGDRAGLPRKDPKPLPNKPLDIDTNEESLKAWKRAAKPVYNFNHRNLSKMVAVAQKIWVADKFSEFEEFFYVWTLDWRGRAYPVGTFVHPQSDDSGKSLLEFAHGKPLGETGVAWLAVQLANTWGNDKVSFDDRVQWAYDNTKDIMAYAMDPLVNTGWMDADAPFAFLAACFEWQGYQYNGESHVCNLPIQVDGSCNGLQNFSAMLRDEIGGRATNLIPADKPQDIYQLVADQANLIIQEDWRVRDVPEAEVFLGGVTRKLTKRNTMTMPYSVTQYGMKDQLLEEFHKMEEQGKGLDFKGLPDMSVASYLAGVNYQAIGRVVVAARLAMDWLKEAASVAASDGLPVVWTNPAGMPCQQAYMNTEGKRVTVYFGGKRTEFHLSIVGKKLNTRKQAAGIAPNFVHSCDSAHMMRTVTLALTHGMSDFSFIHDSFGTHACDMTDLSALLREAFVQQYSGNVLENFRDEIVEQLTRSGAEKLVEKIPPLPPMGNLDLEAIKDSGYFFA